MTETGLIFFLEKKEKTKKQKEMSLLFNNKPSDTDESAFALYL